MKVVVTEGNYDKHYQEFIILEVEVGIILMPVTCWYRTVVKVAHCRYCIMYSLSELSLTCK